MSETLGMYWDDLSLKERQIILDLLHFTADRHSFDYGKWKNVVMPTLCFVNADAAFREVRKAALASGSNCDCKTCLNDRKEVQALWKRYEKKMSVTR